MWDLNTAKDNTHIFSEWLDTVAFTVPILLATVLAPIAWFTIPHDVIPAWAYIVIVVLTDVGHVWSTTFRTHFDSVENSRRSWLYNGTPVALFVGQAAVHFASESLFWTLLGYLAIYHFAKQQYGMLMLAKVRNRDFAGMNRDKYLLYAGALLPIALWHCDPTRKFDWFNRDDPFLFGVTVTSFAQSPLPGLGGIRLYDIIAVAYAVAFGYLCLSSLRQKREADAGGKPFATMKHLLLFYSWLSWAIGVLVNHKVIALSFLNLYHAMPAYIIVFCSTRNRWWFVSGRSVKKDDGEVAEAAAGGVSDPRTPKSLFDEFSKWMTQNRIMVFVYLGFLMALGLAEEFLWEALVWQDYTDHMWEWDPQRDFSPLGYSAACSFLILPQSTHYVLDAFIWKMGKNADGSEQNPSLKKYLAMQF